MADTDVSPHNITSRPDHDAVVVGASLAGCATATFLGRAGLRVALVEKSPDPGAFKRTCSHFIQASAVPTLERLGLLGPIEAAGGLRPRMHVWTRWGWIEAPPERASRGVNLRRELLDPMIRSLAAETPGVDLLLGRTATAMVRRGDAFAGVAVRDRDGAETELRAPLTIGADGRDSRLAELAGAAERTHPHGRIVYGAYYEGARTAFGDDASLWMLDPQWAAAFPTDSGLVMYAVMATKDRLPDFKRDPEGALVAFLADLPDPPPIRQGRRVGEVLGRIDMTNRVRSRVAPGLALVGDAALATDPLFGIGCGWALQSAEWIADSVAPALHGEEPLARGLDRYRRRHRRELAGHAYFIHDYATGRPFRLPERLMMKAACEDQQLAATFDAYATRRIRPGQMLARTVPRLVATRTRRAVGRRGAAVAR